MPRRKISQRDARVALKRVEELENAATRLRANWCTDYPAGKHILNLDVSSPYAQGALFAASALGAAFVGKRDGNNLKLYAVPK